MSEYEFIGDEYTVKLFLAGEGGECCSFYTLWAGDTPGAPTIHGHDTYYVLGRKCWAFIENGELVTVRSDTDFQPVLRVPLFNTYGHFLCMDCPWFISEHWGSMSDTDQEKIRTAKTQELCDDAVSRAIRKCEPSEKQTPPTEEEQGHMSKESEVAFKDISHDELIETYDRMKRATGFRLKMADAEQIIEEIVRRSNHDPHVVATLNGIRDRFDKTAQDAVLVHVAVGSVVVMADDDEEREKYRVVDIADGMLYLSNLQRVAAPVKQSPRNVRLCTAGRGEEG